MTSTMEKKPSRQVEWQNRMIAECRCASCGKQDAETLAKSRRCAKCKRKGRKQCRDSKRVETGCNPWVPGGRGRPPVNKKEVKNEMKELQEFNKLALQLAFEAHSGQIRIGGGDYIDHPVRVAGLVPMRLKPVALLHDAVEDNPEIVNHPDWVKLPDWIRALVSINLNKPKGLPYMEYIKHQVIGNRDAIVVKIADIKDNLADNPSPHQLEKYNAALPVLEAALKQYAHKN